MTTFVDTNIVIYLLDPQSDHHQWSVNELNKAKANGPVVVPDIAYCELSIAMPDKAATDRAIESLALDRLSCSDEFFFRAGRAYKKYKDENSGTKTNVLPDFLIGAQAETAEAPLITANSRDFVGYFGRLNLISPPKST